MEAIINKKDRALNSLQKKNRFKYLDDNLIQDYYLNYYQNLSMRELDEEFDNDIRILTKALIKLPDSEKKNFIGVFSRLIEFYVENKIEKEIDYSLLKILRF